MSLQTEIDRPASRVFRTAQIRRRLNTTGLYEAGFTGITQYVKSWGSIDSSIDDVRLNSFRHSGITLKVQNNDGAFNHHSNPSSLWSGFLGRNRTLVRIQAGYYDTNTTTELPTDPTQGIFIMDKELSIDASTNDLTLRCASLRSIFDEVRAREVGGLGLTLSAGAIMALFRDYTDGAGVAVFQQFISTAAWAIETNSTNNYLLATDTMLENLTVWDVMSKLAESERKVVYITRVGGLRFEDRPALTGTATFTFRGQNYNKQSILKLYDYREALDKVYTVYRMKYLEAETSTSYVTAGTVTAVTSSNTSWLYGNRIYKFENRFPLNTLTAQAVVDAMYSLTAAPRIECRITSKPAPTVEIHDSVFVSYRSYDAARQTLWDGFDWNEANWSLEGQNFDWLNRTFRVISRRFNLDNFTMDWGLREV